jgi:transposase-like protein
MTGQNEAGATGPQTVAKRRRGKWTVQQRRRIVAASRVAGASIQEVAVRHGVRPGLLSAWRRQEAKPAKEAKAQFAAVRVSSTAAQGSIEIEVNGGCVRVCGIVDAAMLREVLAATR